MNDDLYMNRCLQLAKLAEGLTQTNPMVGALLLFQDHIIGEGYHKQYGANHGEIEALNNVREADRKWIPESTLYVNLEPCCHFGKTPPCTDEIIRQGIRRVVIGTVDPNPKVQGKGIEKLKRHGVEVITPVLEKACISLNRAFFTNMVHNRPYIQLKFACSQDKFIGNHSSAVAISNSWSRYIVHKIRREVDGILIGTRTALTDNPQLTNRYYYGESPTRIVLDRLGKIPMHFQIFSDGLPTCVFTDHRESYPATVKVYPWYDSLPEMMDLLLSEGMGSILVEGGAQTLQSFIDQKLWDEIWVTESRLMLGSGVEAPVFKGQKIHEMEISEDVLSVYKPF